MRPRRESLIRTHTNVQYIIKTIKNRNWTYTAHSVCRNGKRWTYLILSIGRGGEKWRNEIERLMEDTSIRWPKVEETGKIFVLHRTSND